MEGLYLYGIREKTEGACPILAKGLDETYEVFILPYQELEAVVSKVSLAEFTSEEIQKKAWEDLNWIKEKAVIHEKVIEEAMRRDDKILSLIPMKFGIIFKDTTGLEEILTKDYFLIKEVLDRIRGKQEWDIKVYLIERKKFEQVIREKNEVVKEKEKEMASLPEGMAFFMEEEVKEVISREMDRELNNIAGNLFERLDKQAVASTKNKILGKELTCKREPMILNAAYLIVEERIEGFKKEVDDLNQEMEEEGVYLEESGPWPAYNFTSY